MQDLQLFQMALGLQPPWTVSSVEFNPAKGKVDITLSFPKGSRFACPDCQKPGLGAHDTTERTWRHLDFFQHQAFLHAKVPRVGCDVCGVKQVAVPWARPGSGFTLLFEALTIQLAKHMAVTAVASLVRAHPDSVWRILGQYVEKARQEQDLSSVTTLGIDETSQKKGHRYVTTFCDLGTSRVLFVTEGKDKATIKAFVEDFEARGGIIDDIEEVCTDMSAAFINGVAEEMPDAALTFDRYHVMAIVNKAVDEVRRQEVKNQPLLKKSRYLFLKNEQNLSAKQAERFESLKGLDLKTVRAYHLKVALQRFFTLTDEAEAEAYLKKWFFWATHARLPAMADAAWTIKRHWNGVLHFIQSRVTNGTTEGINNKIKEAAKRAYGYKTFENYRTIIYLIAGKLNLPTLLPTRSC